MFNIDNLPKGWKIAFGEDLVKEITSFPNYEKYIDGGCHEALGQLCFFADWSNPELNKIMEKYEKISSRTCAYCGAETDRINLRFKPCCENCD